jgi:hypothetical protein
MSALLYEERMRFRVLSPLKIQDSTSISFRRFSSASLPPVRLFGLERYPTLPIKTRSQRDKLLFSAKS